MVKNFLDDFAELAAKNPQHIAMVDLGGTRSTTLGQMEDLICRITAKLESMGFPRGSFLLIRMSRRMEYVAAYYGAIRAGMAVVPTVLDYPEDRVSYIIENCRSPYSITDDFVKDLDRYEPSEGPQLEPESIVCMNYTSGSTGRPKGVYYSLRCVSESIRRASLLFAGLEEVVTAASASLSFAAMCHDCLAPMSVGGTVHLLTDEVRKDVGLMMHYYEQHQIRCGNVSPGMLRFFGHTSHLQRVYTTGERVTNVWSDEHEIWCVYGLTEAFTAVSYFVIDKKYENTPIGKPFGGVVIQILDEEGNEVPDGTEGEINVTWYLSEGYYGMPEATAKVFTDLGNGMRRFATHDLGYKNENGDIVYVNRKDWMVKINGQRVEPFEIEAAINALPGVASSVVKYFPGGDTPAYLCAYYIPEKDNGQGRTVTPEEISEGISRRLPPYMIPAFFVPMEKFPTTVSGKLDRNQLEPPKQSRLQAEYAAPENEAEEKICSAMAGVLKLERIGRNDDFFLLGGDSIGVMELITVLGSDSLRAADVVKGRTPAKIAAISGNAGLELEGEEACLMKSYPLTKYQRNYFGYWEYTGDIALGNTPFLFVLEKGSVTAQQLAEAAREVLLAHPAFSTLITTDAQGQTTQRFAPEIIGLPEVVRCSEDELEELLKTIIRPFHLEGQPLYSCRVYSTEKAEYLFLDTHHIITDAFSVKVVSGDLAGLLQGRAPAADHYAFWLNRISRLEDNWKYAITADSSYARYPAFDREGEGCETEAILVRLKSSVREWRKKAAQTGSATILEQLCAAGLRAIGRYNRTGRAVVNWIYSGRDMKIKENMAGLLLSAMPVPVDLEKFPRKEDLLGEVRRINQHNLAYSDLSPGMIGGRPVYDDTLTVNYNPCDEAGGQEKTGIRTRTLINSNKANSCVFYVIVLESSLDEAPLMMFKYNRFMYDRENMERFVRIYMEELDPGEYEKQ